MRKDLENDRDAFFEEFSTNFFSAHGELKVADEKRQEIVAVAKQSDQEAALACMDAWGADFRNDIAQVTVPALVIHGDADVIVPLEGSAQRTHDAIEGSELVVIEDGPHGINASHARDFNQALLTFLEK
jgi:pimeloyl-ACP methyl ester carboxylesterase